MTVIIDGTNGITNVNGSAAAPAETGTDTDTGLYHGTNTLGLATNGTSALFIDASQNVGIGTSSPAYRFDLQGGRSVLSANSEAFALGLRYNTSTNGVWLGSPSANAFQISSFGGGAYLNINSSGNVGIGTASPSGNFQVSGANPRIRFSNTAGTSSTLLFGSDSGVVWLGAETNAPMYFITNNTERARIDSSGNLLVGLTAIGTQIRLSVQGADTTSGNYTAFFQNPSSTLFFVRNDGVISTGVGSLSPYNLTTASAANLFVDSGGTLYRSTSSLKYKTDVQDAAHGLADVLKLRPVTYKGKNDGDKVFGGLIAEEVHEAGLTEFVQYAEDGSPDALHYGNMVSLCIKAIQELKTQNDDLRARVAALEGAK